MKKQFLITVMGAAIVLAACGSKGTDKNEDTTVTIEHNETSVEAGEDTESVADEPSTAVSKADIKLKYSNLVDEDTRNRVKNALKNAGHSDEKIKNYRCRFPCI